MYLEEFLTLAQPWLQALAVMAGSVYCVTNTYRAGQSSGAVGATAKAQGLLAKLKAEPRDRDEPEHGDADPYVRGFETGWDDGFNDGLEGAIELLEEDFDAQMEWARGL